MKSRLDAQARKDPSEPVAVDGMGAALSARVAEERTRISGRKLSAELPDTLEDPARDAKVMELDALKQFKASEPLNEGVISKAVVSTGR